MPKMLQMQFLTETLCLQNSPKVTIGLGYFCDKIFYPELKIWCTKLSSNTSFHFSMKLRFEFCSESILIRRLHLARSLSYLPTFMFKIIFSKALYVSFQISFLYLITMTNTMCLIYLFFHTYLTN